MKLSIDDVSIDLTFAEHRHHPVMVRVRPDEGVLRDMYIVTDTRVHSPTLHTTLHHAVPVMDTEDMPWLAEDGDNTHTDIDAEPTLPSSITGVSDLTDQRSSVMDGEALFLYRMSLDRTLDSHTHPPRDSVEDHTHDHDHDHVDGQVAEKCSHNAPKHHHKDGLFWAPLPDTNTHKHTHLTTLHGDVCVLRKTIDTAHAYHSQCRDVNVATTALDAVEACELASWVIETLAHTEAHTHKDGHDNLMGLSPSLVAELRRQLSVRVSSVVRQCIERVNVSTYTSAHTLLTVAADVLTGKHGWRCWGVQAYSQQQQLVACVAHTVWHIALVLASVAGVLRLGLSPSATVCMTVFIIVLARTVTHARDGVVRQEAYRNQMCVNRLRRVYTQHNNNNNNNKTMDVMMRGEQCDDECDRTRHRHGYYGDKCWTHTCGREQHIHTDTHTPTTLVSAMLQCLDDVDVLAAMRRCGPTELGHKHSHTRTLLFVSQVPRSHSCPTPTLDTPLHTPVATSVKPLTHTHNSHPVKPVKPGSNAKTHTHTPTHTHTHTHTQEWSSAAVVSMITLVLTLLVLCSLSVWSSYAFLYTAAVLAIHMVPLCHRRYTQTLAHTHTQSAAAVATEQKSGHSWPHTLTHTLTHAVTATIASVCSQAHTLTQTHAHTPSPPVDVDVVGLTVRPLPLLYPFLKFPRSASVILEQECGVCLEPLRVGGEERSLLRSSEGYFNYKANTGKYLHAANHLNHTYHSSQVFGIRDQFFNLHHIYLPPTPHTHTLTRLPFAPSLGMSSSSSQSSTSRAPLLRRQPVTHTSSETLFLSYTHTHTLPRSHTHTHSLTHTPEPTHSASELLLEQVVVPDNGVKDDSVCEPVMDTLVIPDSCEDAQHMYHRHCISLWRTHRDVCPRDNRVFTTAREPTVESVIRAYTQSQ